MPDRADTSYEFDPIALMDAMNRAARPSFDATTKEQAQAWHARTRSALGNCLGFLDTPAIAPNPLVIETVDRGTYVRERIVIRTSAHSELPLYLLIPKSPTNKPRPVVLALNGHGYGVKDIVGLWEDGSERKTPDGYHNDFGCGLAEAGFVVAAPEISGFGERQHSYKNASAWRLNATCHGGNTYAIMLGKSIAGLRVLDNIRTLDYLATRPEVDMGSVATMGISGGGMNAFFSAAMDQRVKAAVISGYFCDWRHSVLDIFHCTCNFVPGLLKLGELSDVAALLAPRPVLVQAGTHDDIFPIEPVKQTVERARKAWRVLGAEQDLQADYFEGRHRINLGPALNFLTQQLPNHH
ncbi:MAG TPA: alpha/beta hydrolase family protein [Tepidisphaeraceae bacterium]|jgi:dienelactone hydrolase